MEPDPDDDEAPPGPLMGPLFWVMIALAVVFVAAGAAVAWFGPRL